ncbi:MAG: carbamoyl phosphate synthase large subunit [Pelagibacterales bacterium]|nr:carbamoyl phosphate synthase large subunit [Pelagibacterales bacterium]
MPKRKDIKSILVLGAGPIVIGQACEFDYSGSQACKVLKEEGYKVILVNSNPATIMTDPEFADATYIEPLTTEIVEKIILKEKPDALLPTMGGQTALNLALSLVNKNILNKHNVELIGASIKSIIKAEDREMFCKAMKKIGLNTPKSFQVSSIKKGLETLNKLELPVIIRPSFTLGGTGGGIAYNVEEFEQILSSGLEASPENTVLVEESVLGWKEYEMEVVRDKKDNAIIVCSIENIDPMGVHTGDSITVAPALTLTDKEYQKMRNASLSVLREIGVETGGSNVQFAVDPKTGKMVVIEMNPRVSRSSALASKATGFPIAKVAARLAIGYTLDEISNEITAVTPASFEPSIDYIVTKIPRFAFEKFPGSNNNLTSSMKSVGEVMAMGRNFQQSFQKALRSLETGLDGVDAIKISDENKIDFILSKISTPTPDRILYVGQAFREKISVDEIYDACKIDKWFLERIKEIIEMEISLLKQAFPLTKNSLLELKLAGFSDSKIAKILYVKESQVYKLRKKYNLSPTFFKVDTCAGEFETKTSYLYSSYEIPYYETDKIVENKISNKKKVIILGGGPNRIGQGIEFDYCCVHAAYSLSEENIETIMINCNPETVSTDYDTSNKLYFEPLTLEDILEIVNVENSKGRLLGLIIQYGGQTPLKLSKSLEKHKIPIIGTSPDSIDLAEDRERFKKFLLKFKLKQPNNGTANTQIQAVKIANKIGYPVIVRPSYVLGGRAMQIVYKENELKEYISKVSNFFGKNPILIDKFLNDAVEVDVDAISDGNSIFIAGIMEHIEEAGIHSGDSACSLPPYSLDAETIKKIEKQTISIAKNLKVVGLLNIQFAIKKNKFKNDIYILEVNPRASRTVPFVAKATGNAIAKIAAKCMIGKKLKKGSFLPWNGNKKVAVKEAVFPFKKFKGVDVLLGPEMKSTGEVMGLDNNFGNAFAKSQTAIGTSIPLKGNIFISVKNRDKEFIFEICKKLIKFGYKIYCTKGTGEFLKSQDIIVSVVNKVREGRPHIVDMIKNKKIDMIFNTTEGSKSISDSFSLREAALLSNIPYYTTLSGCNAVLLAIKKLKSVKINIKSLQSY